MKPLLVLFIAAVALRGDGFFSQFWPEADVYYRISHDTRLELLYSQTRVDNESNTNDEVGAKLDVFLPAIIKRREYRHPDEARNRFLTLTVGYLFDKTPPNVKNQYTAKTALIEFTPRYFLPEKVLVTDENRGDFRFQDGEFAPRYRNRLRAERTFDVRKRREITPYAQAEAFYDSRYKAFYRLQYTGGSEFEVSKNLILEGYYTRQQSSQPKFKSANVIGLTVEIYFP